MNRKWRDVESMVLAMFAAVPLYVTQALSPFSVLLFHLTMGMLALRVALRGSDFGPLRGLIQFSGAIYLLFFPIDAMFISRSLIRASGHLIFFIIIYQTVEASWRDNQRQRFLTTFLLFITSVATATHMSIVGYIAGFAFLCFRHLIQLSHERMSRQLGLEPRPMRPTLAAFSYVLPTALIAGMLFPVLPRVRNPFVSGFSGNLAQSSTGISDSIDFTEARSISPDSDVVARVWMSRDAVPFFTPLRLRVRTYERYDGREWRAPRAQRLRWMESARGEFVIARPISFSREVRIEQRASQRQRSAFSMLYLPVGTHTIRGFGSLMGNRVTQTFMAHTDPRGMVNYSVIVSGQTRPAEPESPTVLQYPITPEVAEYTRTVIAPANTALEAAAKIETHLATRFTYLADPSELGRPVSVEEFLLREKRGHCEYFAAGMVVMLTSLDIPARIVGGYYAGDFNPLTGYFAIRKRDAHAWVELWDGEKWRTYDPTPATLRPGNLSSGLLSAYFTALSDSINYIWDRYILTYGLADQVAFFQQAIMRARNVADGVRGSVSGWVDQLNRPWLLIAIGSVGLAVFLGLQFPRRRSIFDRLLSRISALGIEVSESMTAYEVLEAIRRKRPDLEPAAAQVVDLYVRERFSAAAVAPEARAAALRALTTLA